MENDRDDIPLSEKISALVEVGKYRPGFTTGIIIVGGLVAFFEGIGLSFIYPIMEVGQSDGQLPTNDPIMSIFIEAYNLLGVPLSLSFLILGIGIVMTIRFTSSFVVAWLEAILKIKFERDLRARAFRTALNSKIGYFDEKGSEDLLNAIVTETRYSARVIHSGVLSVETMFLALMYLSVMIYIAPIMTVYAIGLLGGITVLLRYIIEPGYTVGSRVAQANEKIQRTVQAGLQGIRDVKLFSLTDDIYAEFQDALSQFTDASIHLERNKAALQNGYDLAAALSLFVLIYLGFTYSGLSLGALGIFLFAMFRLSPLASRLNSQLYDLEGNLSHLVRTYSFLEEVTERQEGDGGRDIPEIRNIEFKDVNFSYDDETILRDISFAVEKGDFHAFVGQSGAGKSTVVSLLARLYDPDQGEILANGLPINGFDLGQWRSQIAVVRQSPFIFNDTLSNNISIGVDNTTESDISRVCRIAKVDEFLQDLPNGYDSMLGEDGVRLSGGQRQRVAIARALLLDADFLILDEATSDLDSNLEREVQNAIESMERDYGIITIAHRLSTVRNANNIHTMENGKIVESGTHHELLKKSGKYAELYNAQNNESGSLVGEN